MGGRIVVGVDGSAPATAAVEWAAADARRRGLALRLVHVCEQWASAVGSTEYCSGVLEAAAERARSLAPDADVSTGMLSGGVIDALVGESALAESMVLGSRGLGGFAGMVLGSVSMAVAGHAACPVVVVRGTAVVQHGQVVVGYDGSEHSQAAMRYAVEQARARDAQLHVVYAWQLPVFSRTPPDTAPSWRTPTSRRSRWPPTGWCPGGRRTPTCGSWTTRCASTRCRP